MLSIQEHGHGLGETTTLTCGDMITDDKNRGNEGLSDCEGLQARMETRVIGLQFHFAP